MPDNKEDLKKKKALLEKEKKILSNDLLTWMKSTDIGEFETADSFLYRKTIVSKPLGKKNLTTILENYFKEEPEKGQAIKDYIFENLPEKITDKLQRVFYK
jgi:hypothetical protein